MKSMIEIFSAIVTLINFQDYETLINASKL